MRLSYFLAPLAVTLPLVAAWDKDDHEIFRLRDEVMKYEGPNITFYDFIGVKPTATQDEIVKAYRRKSRLIHPDKARSSFLANYASQKAKKDAEAGKKPKPASVKSSKPSSRELAAFTKDANERMARLSLVSKILQGPGRDHYDHFLKNGFPAWRGTGYYYSRYRPGAGSVIMGLVVVFGGAFHYCALYLSWKRQRDFVDRYIKHARRMAWGDEMAIPGLDMNADAGNGNGSSSLPVPGMEEQDEGAVPWNRRQKRQMERENRKKGGKAAAAKARADGISTPVDAELTSGTPQGAKKRVVAENGKVLIVDSVGNVFLEQETDEGDVREFLLDSNEIPKPTLADTLLVRIPKWAYDRSVGRFLPPKHALPPTIRDGDKVDGNGADGLEAEAEDALASAVSTNANVEAGRRRAGKRRGKG